jgi:hypothetical protein
MRIQNYSTLRKTVTWNKKVVFYLINCGLFNSYRIYTALNPQNKNKYKQFLLSVTRDWISDPVEVYRCEEEPGLSAETKRVSRKDPPGRLSGGIKEHFLEEIVSKGVKKNPTRRCRVCASQRKRSDTRPVCKSCGVSLHQNQCFQRYHSLKRY